MTTFIIISFLFALCWAIVLSANGRCPKCDAKLDKAGNDRHCRNCRKLYHMDMFGRLKER